jgi:hypothetical protein
VTVYTDDKDALRDAIRQGREKMTGTELVTRDPHGDATRHRLRLERAAHRAHRAEGMTREPHREAVYE